MNRKIYLILLSFANNIVYNFYLFGFMIYPDYFKNSIIKYKNLSDSYYKKLMILYVTDDIYNKYNIDLIDIHKNILNTIKSFKSNTNLLMNENNNDNISIMSDLSDISDLSDLYNDTKFEN